MSLPEVLILIVLLITILLCLFWVVSGSRTGQSSKRSVYKRNLDQPIGQRLGLVVTQKTVGEDPDQSELHLTPEQYTAFIMAEPDFDEEDTETKFPNP